MQYWYSKNQILVRLNIGDNKFEINLLCIKFVQIDKQVSEVQKQDKFNFDNKIKSLNKIQKKQSNFDLPQSLQSISFPEQNKMLTREIQLLQQKVVHLQADNIIYQEQVSRLRKRIMQLQQYRIKYEMLLQKQSSQSPQLRNRRVDEINNMNKKIEENNDKWSAKVRLLETKYEKTIGELEEQSLKLMRELETIKPRLSGQDDRVGLLEINKLKQQGVNMKSRNSQLNAELLILQSRNKQLSSQLEQLQSKQYDIQSLKQQSEQKIQEARNEEKQFYRNTIVELQALITKQNEQIEFHKVRASPEREKEIGRLSQMTRKIQIDNDQQVLNYAQVIRQRQQQVQSITQLLNLTKSQSHQHITSLQQQLQQSTTKLLTLQQQQHNQLMACRLQMQQLRQQQTNLLKEQFYSMQRSFQAEREQWKLILKEQQDEMERIKSLWEEEKQKYLEEKERLKAKIQELKDRFKLSNQGEKQKIDDQTHKIITGLKMLDEQDTKFNDYQNGVVFLHRQLKRAANKLQENQRQINKLLNQLKQQHQEFQTETDFIKKVERSQVQFYKEKLLQADQQNTRQLEELRDKEKYIRIKEQEHNSIYARLQQENQSLRTIMQEMQRDYRRLTENKRELFQSYRSERDLVFTGKAEINQERKKKYSHLSRQKHQLEISYKERENQIRDQYELTINQLQQKLARTSQEQAISSAQVQILKERANEQEPFSQRKSEQNMKDFHKKIASLDLQINLTQNLYSTLQSVRARQSRRSDVQEVSVESQQGSMSSLEKSIRDMLSNSAAYRPPTFSPKLEINQGIQNFSFKSHQVEKPTKQPDVTFNPQETFGRGTLGRMDIIRRQINESQTNRDKQPNLQMQ